MLLVLQVINLFPVFYKYMDLRKTGKNIEREENYTKKSFHNYFVPESDTQGQIGFFGPFVWVSVHHFTLAE